MILNALKKTVFNRNLESEDFEFLRYIIKQYVKL